VELTLKARLRPWFDRIDTLALRERVLLMSATVAVLFLLMDGVGFEPTLAAQRATGQNISQLSGRLETLERDARRLNKAGQETSIESLRDRRDTLRGERDELDNHIRGRLGALVEPAQAAQVLEQLVDAHTGLELIALSASTEPLGDSPAKAPDGAAELARYQVEMVVKGDYLAVLDYLKNVERMPWKFFWQQVGFRSTGYPDGETRLQLYTLGPGHG
jgi:MSHA biogenesis protein MshJ